MTRAAPSIDAELQKHLGIDEPMSRKVPAAVRAYLEMARTYLAHLHEAAGSGRVVNEANSDLMDRLVRRLFALAEEDILTDGGQMERGVAVVAVGGYARREMSIRSDVDLLILYRDELTPYVAGIAERLQYWLWDAGLTVGCATRTLEETVSLGREDLTVRTAVLTARFLCGDGEFFHVFADRIREELVPDVPAFIAEVVEHMQGRHTNYGESLFLLQPNVKEGAGTLRDYHTAYWIARAAQPSLRDVDDLLHFGLLTEPEMDTYRAALDFLWRVRNELHLRTRRATDQMSFELQELVAEGLGYGSMDEHMGHLAKESPPPVDTGLLEMRLEADDPDLPVERFMRDYYMHARVIQNFSQLIIDQCRARANGVDLQPRISVEVEEGFSLAGDHLEIPHSAHLRERPIRLLLAFVVAQSHDVPLSRMARRFIRENLDLVTDDRRADPSWVAAFERVLNAEKRVTRTLMTMNEVGFLGAFMPEWQHIVCRWQHVIYHTYTVDVHSIFLVEELRRLWQGKYEKAMSDLTRLMRSVDDRAALFLGCMLHDIGKGFGGDHSHKGVVRAIPLVERLGLSEERAARVIFIVEHHLLMSHLSQSRDLSDPRLLFEFAQLCGDRTNLRNLYLATFADIRASSRDAWTDWKGQLLAELYERAAEMLETGADDPTKAMELIEARVEKRRDGAREELAEQGIDPGDTETFFAGMHRRYFVTHTPRQIARHAKVVLQYARDQDLSTAFRTMRGDFTEFILCTRDVHGLYSMVAGTLAAQGINILGSHVYTSRDGLALEIYRISTPPGGEPELELAWAELRAALGRVIRGEARVEDLRARRLPHTGHGRPPSRKAPRVAISTEESDFYTVVDVIADDRLGLLFDVTRCIGDFDLEIYISKAATIKDQVTDTFYLKDSEGKKPTDRETLEALRAALLLAAEGKREEADE
jgi:[protein-PII] uridylyltransferase